MNDFWGKKELILGYTLKKYFVIIYFVILHTLLNLNNKKILNFG